MGGDRSKKASPFGVGFLPKHFSGGTRGRFVDSGNGFPPPKETLHFRVTSAGEEQDLSVGTKPLSLLWLSYTTMQHPFDNRWTLTSGIFSSSYALQHLSSLSWEKENTVSLNLHESSSHTQSLFCHTWLTPGQHPLGNAEDSELLNVAGSSFILSCVLSSTVLSSNT